MCVNMLIKNVAHSTTLSHLVQFMTGQLSL